ncbi:M28 family peptidase [Natronospira bacteriovora]|uniref:Carboxypeptidase Q n=1 Tax=Natronospira bacteriovora TaxID=3069753 RepID=A0ABU0W5R4_9GAMM|nr:M28 family peptidase [Natronospira sp. AB-CW4]MDQ2069103.1 M28 family peptidase [Natronospira sp. AB-CW4]
MTPAPFRTALLSLLASPLLLSAPLLHAEDEVAQLPEDMLETARQLKQTALESDLAWDLTEGLLTEVGPRFAGTDGDRAAVSWALTRMRELGFQNIQAEEVEVPRWVRGDINVEITAPYPQDLVAVALGGSIGTPDEGIEAPVRQVYDVEELRSLSRSQVEGHIVFFSQRMERTRDASGYVGAVGNRTTGPAVASEMGAVAAVIRSIGSSDERVAHTGGTRFPDDVKRIPAAALSNPDADLLERQVATGRPVTMKLRLTSRMLEPTKSANVIGEIPGSDPDAGVVLLGAHLDSWDITPGAHDAAACVGIVTSVAHMISQMDEQPKRTLRVVLFANEEFGLSGARTYAENRRNRLDEHYVGIGADLGAFAVWRFDTVINEDAMPVARALHQLIEPLGVEMGTNEGYGIPDFIPLREAGMPVLDPLQDAAPYFDIHHTINDTLAKVDPEQLRQNVAVYAALTWMAANMDVALRPTPEDD